MTIIPLHEKGDPLPDPMTPGAPLNQRRPKPTLAEEIDDAQRVIIRNKAALLSLNSMEGRDTEKPPGSTGINIKADIDLGQIITDNLRSMKALPPEVQAQMAEQTKVLEKLQAKLEGTSPQQSPMQTYQDMAVLIELASKQLLERLAAARPAEPQAAPVADPQVAVEIEKLKGDREQRQQEHAEKMSLERNKFETEGEERRRRWAIEDKHWEQDFRLKEMQVTTSGKAKDSAMRELGNIIGAFADSIEPSASSDVSAKASEHPEAQENPTLKARATSFSCRCGERVEVSNPQPGVEALCPKCGLGYKLVE